MTLKTKYRTLLFVAIGSVPVVLLGISVFMSILYNKAFKTKNNGIPFHESFAYPVMLLAFVLSLGILALLFSTSIHSLLARITMLNQTIRELASNERIPNTLTVSSEDELGQLIHSVNLLIERTTYRELELAQQQELQKELLQKLRHDIHTPLTAIRLQLFYLEDQLQEQPKLVESLNEQIQYIANLTNELPYQSFDTSENSFVVQEEVRPALLLEIMIRKWRRPRSPTTQGRTAGRAPVTQVTASPTARLTDCSPTRATREVAVMDRPNQPGGNETGSDRLFEESWRAAQAGLRKRAQRLARGNSHRAEEWLSSTAVKALLFLRQSPERVRDPQGFLFLVLEHVYLDSARHQIREDRLIDRGIDLHDGQLERFAAVGSPLERLEQLERLDQVDKALASLSRQQQQLFELRFIEELPYADIASQLGIAPPLVRKRVQLLRSRLSADFFAGDVSQDRRSRVHS